MYSRVYLEIGNVCNKNCSFCHKTKRPPQQMTFDEFSSVARKIRHLTDYLYLHLMGEPLFHSELFKMIEYSSSLGFKACITTNGSLLSRYENLLISSAVYKINISLHSFEGESGEMKNRYLSDCLSFADKASRAGILTVLRLWNGDKEHGKNGDTYIKIREFFKDEEWALGGRGARIRQKLHLEYGEEFAWPDINLGNMGDEVFCYGLSDHFGILADGTVVPCCLDADGVVSLGNIHKDDIDEILSSERAKAIKNGFLKCRAVEELCKRCGYARRFKIKNAKRNCS